MAVGAIRVAIGIDGVGAEATRTELIAALPAGAQLISPSGVDAAEILRLTDALSRQRIDDRAFGTAEGKHRPMLIKKLRKVAGTIGVDALISGALAGSGRKDMGELQLIVVLPSQNNAVFDETILLRKAGAARARQLKHLLAAAFDGVGGESETTAEVGADPPPAVEPRAKPVEDSIETRPSATDALLVGFGGLDFGGRQFHYNQRITNVNLRPYDLPQGPLLPVTPGAATSVEFYPLARVHFEKAPWGVARDVGVTAHVGYNFAKAQVGAVTLKTEWYSWELNLRVRWHLGDRGSSPLIGLEGGLGRQVFVFKDDPAIADTLPGVDYHYWRGGADCRIPVGKLAVVAGVAYRRLMNRLGPTGATIVAAGSVGEHFPRAEIAGLDARIGGALPFARNVEARLVLSYVRYWASFHSRPGDTYIAGGALEQFLNADLGIAVFF